MMVIVTEDKAALSDPQRPGTECHALHQIDVRQAWFSTQFVVIQRNPEFPSTSRDTARFILPRCSFLDPPSPSPSPLCAVIVVPAAAYFSGFGAGAVQVRAARTGTDAVAVSIRSILWCALGEINGLVGGAPAFQDVGSGQDSLPVESGAGRLLYKDEQ
jgi:hypothetical protein